MTTFELADLLTFVLVPVIGGVIAWLLKINNKVVAQCVEVKAIKDADTKTGVAISEINNKLDTMQQNITRICAHLEIQEVPIKNDTRRIV